MTQAWIGPTASVPSARFDGGPVIHGDPPTLTERLGRRVLHTEPAGSRPADPSGRGERSEQRRDPFLGKQGIDVDDPLRRSSRGPAQ